MLRRNLLKTVLAVPCALLAKWFPKRELSATEKQNMEFMSFWRQFRYDADKELLKSRQAEDMSFDAELYTRVHKALARAEELRAEDARAYKLVQIFYEPEGGDCRNPQVSVSHWRTGQESEGQLEHF